MSCSLFRLNSTLQVGPPPLSPHPPLHLCPRHTMPACTHPTLASAAQTSSSHGASLSQSHSSAQVLKLDSEGAPTEWPFPGGSIRWKNVGSHLGLPLDLLLTLTAGSNYTRPSMGEAVTLHEGFTCVRSGVRPSVCSNGGSIAPSWSPGNASSACWDAPQSELLTGGECRSCLPLARCLRSPLSHEKAGHSLYSTPAHTT